MGHRLLSRHESGQGLVRSGTEPREGPRCSEGMPDVLPCGKTRWRACYIGRDSARSPNVYVSTAAMSLPQTLSLASPSPTTHTPCESGYGRDGCAMHICYNRRNGLIFGT